MNISGIYKYNKTPLELSRYISSLKPSNSVSYMKTSFPKDLGIPLIKKTLADDSAVETITEAAGNALEKAATGAETFEGAGDIAEHFAGGESIYGLSFLIKGIKPLNDVVHGRFGDAISRGVVRFYDTLLLPVKYTWGAIGGIKGAYLSARGIKSDHTGLIKGFKYNYNNWIKKRNEFEECCINPDLIDEPSTAEKYAEAKSLEESRIMSWQYKVKEKSQKQGEKLAEWFNSMYSAHAKAQDEFAKILETETIKNEQCTNHINTVLKNDNYDDTAILKDLNELKKEKNALESSYNEYIAKLKMSLVNLGDEELIMQRIKEITTDIKQEYETKKEVLAGEINKINNLILINKIQNSQKELPPMQRIAGYKEVISEINNSLLAPIRKIHSGKKATPPNVVMFYGPKGCGKTLIANSIEEESGCNIINLETTLDASQDLKNLEQAIESAKKHFEETGRYSLIRIEEMDSFLNGKQNENYSSTVNLLSGNNHCTILGTTNFPNNVNKNLLPANGTKTIFISYADKADLSEIIKYYSQDFARDSVRYDKLAQQLTDKTDKNGFSNAQVKNGIIKGIKSKFVQNGKLTEQDLSEILKDINPDIEIPNSNLKKGI